MSVCLFRSVYSGYRFSRQSTYLRNLRYYSSERKDNKIRDLVKAESKQLQQKYSRENVRQYFFTRFFNYISNYDKILEKRFPAAMHVYRVFMVGVKDFYSDMKKYFKVNAIMNSSEKGIKALTRKEMELWKQMPRDMMKVAPVLLISALPFANYVIFPLAYMYPRQLLTSHFWSIQQKSEFQDLFLKERTSVNRKIFRILQAKLESTKSSEHYKTWNYILGLLGSGTHPTADEIISVRNIFNEKPYSIGTISSSHLKSLCKLHGIHSWYLKRLRLSEYCYTMHHIDLAIKSEGGVHNLTTDALRYSCYLRGLNPSNLRNEEMIEWLRDWIKISLTIRYENVSLYVHLPILLSYNHPNNWKLTHN
ncbi:CLUMA_CG009201, isoform A [Clunio marinus]|uniref:CLUMA_CG009201, isoform A n=1 Tax=Clunio marinus TaxID=568069 RepID=A0A1J1I650_9DIPT|nr:CLUMA_CG009201, isoform A [Clunio marinus]